MTPMVRGLAVMLLVGAAVTLTGASCNVQKEYVSADEATYKAVAPQYLQLVEEAVEKDGNGNVVPGPDGKPKPKYTQEQKARFKNTVDSWKLRIDKQR